MLPLPKSFDKNEIFLITVLFLLILIIRFLPKRFPKVITILILLEAFTIARLADHLLASAHVMGIDFYDIMDTGKYEFFGLFTYLIFAPFGYLFVYLYDWIKPRGVYLCLYIISWSLFSTCFEWIMVLFDIYKYKNWNLAYSSIVYLVVQPLTILFFEFLIREYNKMKE
ncbi:hypothetical protein BX659_11911 [Orenia metallireducens]|jgi:hypothetical protein|uniref:Uncharacterized protein n=1 Tax=Orenia metallireducens TaxID=1413210 RepID=A0A285HM34_9FIRM|nr:hypothetical protein [Orenia metallireducens]PRX26647.1 hypothetical protein BX659_11911 [Orenia metallireducens]SNY35826.1 hypothetical protein SAMN06265827_12011 [Orenia metallireducens]